MESNNQLNEVIPRHTVIIIVIINNIEMNETTRICEKHDSHEQNIS